MLFCITALASLCSVLNSKHVFIIPIFLLTVCFCPFCNKLVNIFIVANVKNRFPQKPIRNKQNYPILPTLQCMTKSGT